jgi:anaerobic selenocysteine-containing dehydrogenase
LSNLEREFQLKTARQHGYDTVTSIMSMHEGEANVFYAFSGDYIQATPYTVFTSLTLLNCYLTVHICTKLNRSHVITGRTDLILPCLGRSEKETRNRVGQFLTVENSMSVVHASHGKLHPASPNLLSEPEIVARKAAATALSSRSRTPWLELGTNCNQIRDLLARVAPGFENFHESSPQQRVERRPSAGVRQANVYRP